MGLTQSCICLSNLKEIWHLRIHRWHPPNIVIPGIKREDWRSLGSSVLFILSVLDVGRKGKQPLNKRKQIMSAWLIEAERGTPQVAALDAGAINLLPQKDARCSHKYFTQSGVAFAFPLIYREQCQLECSFSRQLFPALILLRLVYSPVGEVLLWLLCSFGFSIWLLIAA